MIEFTDERDDKNTFTTEEDTVFCEHVQTVGSTFKVTRNADGTIFSTTQEVNMSSGIPMGSDFKTTWSWQRIQCTNKINNDYNNRRIKSPLNK